MDPLSITASIIAVITLVKQAADITLSGVSKYKNSPDEILKLKDQALRTLESIKDVFTRELQQSQKSKTSSPVKWALYKEAQIKEWNEKLLRHLNGLNAILSVVNTHYLTGLNSMHLDLKTVARNVVALQPKTDRKFISGMDLSSNEWFPTWVPRSFQVDLNSSTFENTRKAKHHEASVRLRLPILHKVSRLKVDLALRPSYLLWTPLKFPSFTIKNEVYENSEIFVACKKGHSLKVWELIKAGEASHKDVTPDNSSPLRFAIESGVHKTVAILLNNGADPNGTFGRFSTSPLEWAFAARQISIVRLLLQSGSFAEFEAQDRSGWSCTHRCAGYGSTKDILHLTNIKAPLLDYTRDLLWAPIFCAAHLDSEATFQVLRDFQDDFLTVTDVRDWGLLHVAVYSGSFKIMRELLRLGAGPLMETQPASFVPEQLKGQVLTPVDIARYRRKETFKAFVDCVQEYHLEVDFRLDDETGDEEAGDFFWPAGDT
ncbi:uncharacterized protein PAC_11137 [Phialocephala subalpina]|uniref:Uncharacterized protein n=1 Tax=Phialocephala subalpina TaxID=576137 RepID=A0A1L7X895_9HELO|nr:uncharacterized protein PAC_11137 [Phialocephala subalpina]